MTDLASRRAFLRGAWRDARAAAPQVASAVVPAVRPFLRGPDGPASPGRDVIDATAVKDTATVDELLSAATEFRLADRLECVRSLVRRSVRLVPAATAVGTGRSRLGEPLAQIDLAELTSLGVGHGLPADGLLHLDCDISDEGPRWRGPQAVLVGHIPEGKVNPPPATHASAIALLLSVELSLPRVWSAPVAALDLDESEQQGWQELRGWLARRQGVELFDQVEVHLAAHRLFGYPDERTGEMPLICELLAAGAVIDDHPIAHPRARELEALARRWRLLLQLSAAEELAWPWAARYERLYFWIDEQRLEAGDLSEIFAVAQ
jgi:hypothetical protein